MLKRSLVRDDIMLVIADGFRRPILLFLLWYHFLIFGKLTGIDLVQIWIALVPKGTGSVPQSMGKRNWSRSKGNWEIPISDQIGSGDGWSSTCTVENGWRWSRTAFPILNNQHMTLMGFQSCSSSNFTNILVDLNNIKSPYRRLASLPR